MKIKVITIASTLAITLMTSAFADTFNVLGTSNPWLAGMPDDSTFPGDGMPFEFLNFAPGDLLKFSASGSAGYQAGAESGPDGVPGYDLSNSPANNISGIMHSQANALIAVFLNGTEPDLDSGATPDTLDFGPGGLTLDYSTLTPSLRQMFYIGDGLTSTNDQQTIVAPNGATRLFVGMNDGSGWYNNTGSFDVTVKGNTQVVPEPTAFALIAAGIGALALVRRRNQRA